MEGNYSNSRQEIIINNSQLLPFNMKNHLFHIQIKVKYGKVGLRKKLLYLIIFS